MSARTSQWLCLLPAVLAASGAVFGQGWKPAANPPTAHAASPARLPAWPQKFEVRGPESASFGLAVTQPGPIVVDVRSQGAPLRVALVGPSRVEQTGTGRVVLNYVVTPADVQRAILWTVSINLQTPAPTTASGELTVQHPPSDAAAAQRAVQGLAMSRQQIDQANAIANAHVEQAIAARRVQFAQEIARREQADRERFQGLLKNRPAANASPVRSRGVDESESNAPQSSDGVTTRAGGDRRLNFPDQVGARLQALTQAPPYQISALSEGSGGPKKGLVITGTGFRSGPGPNRGVYLTIPSGLVAPCPPNSACALNEIFPRDKAQPAAVLSWSDTSIAVELPEIVGVMPYQAEIFVYRDGEFTNRVPFNFVPQQELRTIRAIPGDRRHSGSVLTTPLVDGQRMLHLRTYAIPFGEFAGEKGNDEYFLLTQLKNGWTVSGVQFFPPGAFITAGGGAQEMNQVLGASGGAYVEQQGSGTQPYLNVRWWIHPFKPLTLYRYAIDIIGPAGVPDGIVVP